MCGIVTLWGRQDPTTVRDMLDALEHRGPDGRAVHTHHAGPTATLGHTRLAIIDPAGGHQPLVSAHDGAALVCNGMIYNDRVLRARLADAPFRSGSDSECILHGYAAWGPAVVEQLDGMFAFVLVDGEGACFAARDRLGKKPLYWGRIGDSIAFASEIGALAGVASDIAEFPAGHAWHSSSGLRRYYAVPDPSTGRADEQEAAAAVRVTLERAVAKRMRSDVPLGAFLSGGLDSSAIAALARRHVDELHTYAVGLPDSSDLAAARRVAEHIGSIHHEHVITPGEIADTLPRVVRHLESHDRDLVRSAVPTWFVSRLAARDVKVILTGEGADELFAGYTYHGDYRDADLLQRELQRSLTAMHNVNLQRVDRMTMAHSLEARVPFLDPELIALALDIPAALKQRPAAAGDGAKWILRRACEDLLPREIVWRDKLQFDQGSGFSDHLAHHARREQRAGRLGGVPAANAEETLYARLQSQGCPTRARAVQALTAHWRQGRTERQAA